MQDASGTNLYKYPGEAVESDQELNGADDEENCQRLTDDESSSHESFSTGSDISFNSSKLFDGFKQFQQQSQKQEPKEESPKQKQAKANSRSSSLSLSACYNCCQGRLVAEKKKTEDLAEFDLNISFSGGYVPNTDLIRVDKGQGNPQFGVGA